MVNKADNLVLYAVGDVAPYREEPASILLSTPITNSLCLLRVPIVSRKASRPQSMQ